MVEYCRQATTSCCLPLIYLSLGGKCKNKFCVKVHNVNFKTNIDLLCSVKKGQNMHNQTNK